jgi:hypothetical protein
MPMLEANKKWTGGSKWLTGFAERKVVVEIAGKERMAIGMRMDNAAGRRG